MKPRGTLTIVWSVGAALALCLAGAGAQAAGDDLPPELAAVAEQYASGDWKACMEAGNALSDLGEAALPLAPTLAALYAGSPDSDCGQDAVRGLLNIGPGVRDAVPADEIVPRLLAQIDSIEGAERTEAVSDAESAVTVLGFYGDRAASAVPTLVRILGDAATPFDRRPVAAALGAVGAGSPEAAEALLAILEDDTIDQWEEMGVRAAAARGLGGYRAFASRSGPALVAVLDGPDGSLDYAARDALEALGPAATPALSGALAEVDDESLDPLLRILTSMGPSAAAACPALVEELATHEGYSFYELGEALTAIGPGDGSSVQALAALVSHDNGEVASTAIRVLGAWGPAAADALPALEKAAAEGSWMVRSDAEEAVARIKGE